MLRGVSSGYDAFLKFYFQHLCEDSVVDICVIKFNTLCRSIVLKFDSDSGDLGFLWEYYLYLVDQ